MRKGLCPVSQARGQSEVTEKHAIYYEQHGTGPEKIVLIMGLNSSSFSWLPQVEYLPKARDGKYSVLVFDNRGVGNSSTPRGPYTTRGMAEDIVLLLETVGWTELRGIHVVGVSLGGMVAQELACLIGERIASLTLCVTTAGGMPWNNLPPWKGLASLTRLTFMTDPAEKIPIILDMLFPQAWLDTAASGENSERTNRVEQFASHMRRFQITRPQKLIGVLSQMSSALTHHVSPERLRQISTSIPKVLILTGDQDHLVHPSKSFYLAKHMPEAEFVQWKDSGHALSAQWPDRFHALLERVFDEGRQRC